MEGSIPTPHPNGALFSYSTIMVLCDPKCLQESHGCAQAVTRGRVLTALHRNKGWWAEPRARGGLTGLLLLLLDAGETSLDPWAQQLALALPPCLT